MDTSGLLSPQEAKDRVQAEVDQISQCLERKIDEMLTNMETLEKEYISKQQQKQKKVHKINSLITETEKLTHNNLLEVLAQNRIKDLQNVLSIASLQESDCSVEFEWGFSRDVICKINSITLKRLDTDKDEDRTSRKCPPNPDLNTDNSLPNSQLARSSNRHDSNTTDPILPEASVPVGLDLIVEKIDTDEQMEPGDFRERQNLDRECGDTRRFNRDSSLDSEANVVNQGQRCDRESNNSNREREPSIHTGRNRESICKEVSTDLNPTRADMECTYEDIQAEDCSIDAQSDLSDNDIEDVLIFVPENKPERNRNTSQRTVPRTSRMSHPRNTRDNASSGFTGRTGSNR